MSMWGTRIRHTPLCGCCDTQGPVIVKNGSAHHYIADMAVATKAAGWKPAWIPALGTTMLICPDCQKRPGK